MFKKIAIMLAIMLAMSGAASAAMYYIVYNIPVEVGSEDDGLYLDGYFHLMRIYSIAPGQALAVPKACSKFTWEQWNATELQTGGYEGALEFYQIDQVDLMY